MARVFRLTFVASVLLCSRSVLAQDVLTLSQAVQQTVAHNRSLKAAQAGVREADARLRQSRSAYFPRVSVVESWQRGDQPVFVFSSLLSARQFSAANFAIDALNSPDATGFFRSAVSFEQVLFDGGRTGAAVSAAALRRDIATLGADETAAGLAVAVTTAYGRVLSAQAAVRAADAAIAGADEDVTRATLRRDAGTLNDADVLAMNVRLMEFRQRRIQSADEEAVAKAELNRLMGSPIDRDFDVQSPLAPAWTPVAPGALFAEAEAARPDLKRLTALEGLADTARQQARASWYPQIAAQAQVEAAGTRVSDRASSWIVGGELRWTLSTGGAERAERTAALEAASRARLEHEDARAAMQVEIVTAQRHLQSALARRAIGEAAAEQARESQRIIRDRFDAGLAGTNDVLRAATSVLDADTQRVAALVDALVSRAALDRALGRQP